jgi:hypothetical protein
MTASRAEAAAAFLYRPGPNNTALGIIEKTNAAMG